MKRHYQQWHLRQRFLRKLEQLHFELELDSSRRVLDYLLEHAEDLLAQVEASTLRDSFTDQLALAKSLVSVRHNLRLVKGTA